MPGLELHDGAVDFRLRPGKYSVGRAPLHYSNKFPFGVIQINVNPWEFAQGRLTIESIGRKEIDFIKIWREDYLKTPDFEPTPMQVNYIYSGPRGEEHELVFAKPVNEIALKNEAGVWVVEGNLGIISPVGFDKFIRLVTTGTWEKQKGKSYAEFVADQDYAE